MPETPQTRAARRWTALLAAVVLVTSAALGASTGAGAATAPVGTYTVVSCTQPNGTPAPTDGWRAGSYGAAGDAPPSAAANTCATGGNLTATSSSASIAGIDTGPEWTFTAPAGMTIAGGFIDASLTAPQGQAWLGTPLGTDDVGDALASCTVGQPCGSDGAIAGAFAISHPGGTSIYAPALCVDPGQTGCPAGSGSAGVNAQVAIHQAEIELDASATPSGHDFSGSLLAGRASRTAQLSFTAQDPATAGGEGPGIYSVAVTVDGASVYSGTPNTDGGDCVALGTDPVDGAPIFDHTQPCKASEQVTVPVDTAALPDGSHKLSVTVTDAAGDVATVLRRNFTSSNPVTTPAPADRHEVAAQFVLGWRWRGATTTLVSGGARDLPPGGTVTLRCQGTGCPSLRPASVPVARIATLFARLRRLSFRAGDRLYLTIAAPAPPVRHGRRKRALDASTPAPEHLLVRIRRGGRPTARLVGSVPSAD